MNAKLILVINCGSSSIKFSVVEPGSGAHLVNGMAEKLDSGEAVLRWQSNGDKVVRELGAGGHDEAVRAILKLLEEQGALGGNLVAVGHRVVHGGEHFRASEIIDDRILSMIESCNHLAPLHNPANGLGIRVARKLLPNVPHVAVFDTAFHQSMPPRAYFYAVPYALYEEHGVRRYGFHGSSHRFVIRRASEMLDRPYRETALISAHLGNGCSAAAVLNGHSVDTTMGLTPLEGLVMGTRSGDVDPSLHAYLAGRIGKDLDGITSLLNKESGLVGLSGLSNDMRTLLEAAEQGHERARLAVDVFCYRLAKALAGMAVPLGRIDALIFTGGIGENAAQIREQVLDLLTVFGFRTDAARNAAHGRDSGGRITGDAGPVALVVPTDEELMIARDAVELVG